MKQFSQTSVLAYGGSIIIPGEKYDQEALEKLAQIVLNNPETQFVFIIGGGKICRNINSRVDDILNTALGRSNILKAQALDELGIAATKINARYTIQWLKQRLGDKLIYPEYLDNPEMTPQISERVVIASGFRPGVTTDYCMMRFAQHLKATKAYKISNFPVVLDVKPLEFDKDKINQYRPIDKISWQGIVDLVGTDYVPGGNYPLDPPSAVLGLELSQINSDFCLYIGQKDQLDNMLMDRAFTGTMVSS